MDDISGPSPSDFEAIARTLFDYGPVAIGLLLLFWSLWLLRLLRTTNDPENKRLIRRSFWVVLPSGLCLLFVGGALSAWIEVRDQKFTCLPFDSRLKQVHVELGVIPDSDNTFATPWRQKGDEWTYRVIAVRENEVMRFVISNRLDYFPPKTRRRGDEEPKRSKNNKSRFAIDAKMFSAGCKTHHLIYNEKRDIIFYEAGLGSMKTIKPYHRTDYEMVGLLRFERPSLKPLKHVTPRSFVGTAFAGSKEQTDFKQILPILDHSKTRDQSLGVEVLADNFNEYRKSIAQALVRKDISLSQRFALVSAVRLSLRKSLVPDNSGNLVIAPGTKPLGPAIDRSLLRLSMVGDRATRLNARAILRTRPSKHTVAEFTKVLATLTGDSTASLPSPQTAKASLLLTGLDIYYNYAFNTTKAARVSNELDPSEREKFFAQAFDSLDQAWKLRDRVPADYRIDFVKALYGQAWLWVMVAEQMSLERLPKKINFDGKNVSGPKAALQKVVSTLSRFEKEAPAIDREFYTHKKHFERSQSCPKKIEDNIGAMLKATAQCLGVTLQAGL